MNVYDGIHWNIYEILPFQRGFNFINGIRSTGKTYTGQWYVLDKCIMKNREFIFVVRTKTEKEKGALEKWFKKLIFEQYKNTTFEFTNEKFFLCNHDEENKIVYKKLLGYCIALSEVITIKNTSFPHVHYILMDEYMLEDKHSHKYVTGWNEPDLLLNLYHTVDREEDRVKCFLFGNNTKFWNPYHMHKAFNIPKGIKQGEIWTSKNVLFQWLKPSDGLIEKKSKCKFLEMIEETQYGEYASKGNYTGDNYDFIEKLSGNLTYHFTFLYSNNQYGVYSDLRNGIIYISDKIDKSCKMVFALTRDDHTENTLLTKSRSFSHLKFLANAYKTGNVRFVSMAVKVKAEEGIISLL